jgi:hypothetical protein
MSIDRRCLRQIQNDEESVVQIYRVNPIAPYVTGENVLVDR